MPSLKYTKLGRTGLDVSQICLGCMSYGSPNLGAHDWALDEAASRPFIKQALDHGINFFDTANVYSPGASAACVAWGRTTSICTSASDRVIVDRVGEIADARGLPRAQVALAWMLHKPVITSPIVGATKPHHLDDAVAALDVELEVEEIEALEEPYTPHPVVGFA